MFIQKGKTYQTSCGKLVKILWEYSEQSTEGESQFVGVFAPYTEFECIIEYDSDGKCSDMDVHRTAQSLSETFNLMDIVSECNSEH